MIDVEMIDFERIEVETIDFEMLNFLNPILGGAALRRCDQGLVWVGFSPCRPATAAP
jgi:hypothetical protein